MENMELWNKVCKTDPAITKHVNQRGGFTAICAQAQLKRATELWGPYGEAWGLFDLEYQLLLEKDVIVEIALDANFRFPGVDDILSFPISADMAYKPGNDSRKKLRTDCITKALSALGFNSDVFEGKFDDNKYVTQMKKEFGGKDAYINKPLPKDIKDELAASFQAKPEVDMMNLRSEAGKVWLNKFKDSASALAALAKKRTITNESHAYITEFFEV